MQGAQKVKKQSRKRRSNQKLSQFEPMFPFISMKNNVTNWKIGAKLVNHMFMLTD